ncbi:MAG: hypothetical protein KatS3mg064_2333 [Tepidiforma sp.]|nr:hypothetical protein [Tepidiforma sp.]GIW19176.1 MAG: hypothetical protein KatS3mg064_2333 [Tepidiforma sp.]
MSSDELTLAADAARALREAQALCYRTNCAIVAPEHLLAACLLQLRAAGLEGLPEPAAVQQALVATQGLGEDPLDRDVIFGSAAREAISRAAAAARAAGSTTITCADLATALVESGECSPMFFASLGVPRAALLELLRAPGA